MGKYEANRTLHVASDQAWWEREGYIGGREIEDAPGYWICVAPMTFTYRLMICTPQDVLDFYCYEQRADALAAFCSWDGESDPGGPYTRHGVH